MSALQTPVSLVPGSVLIKKKKKCHIRDEDIKTYILRPLEIMQLVSNNLQYRF